MTLWITLGAVLLAAVGIGVALLIHHQQAQRQPPAFVPAPGKFRVVAQHGRGNPQPTSLILDATRVTVAFGAVFRENGVARAGMSLAAPSEPGAPRRDYAVYQAGDTVTLGSVEVRVLAIYPEPDDANDAVDLQLTFVE